MEKKRSKGVTIYSYLFILYSIFLLIINAVIIGILCKPGSFDPELVEKINIAFKDSYYRQYLNPFHSITASLAAAFFYIVIGFALLRLNELARKAVVYLSIFGVILNLISLFSTGTSNIRLAASILVIFFFTRPKVKEQFRRE